MHIIFFLLNIHVFRLCALLILEVKEERLPTNISEEVNFVLARQNKCLFTVIEHDCT